MAAPIYADGKPRPRWRGVVHRFVARWLCYGCAMLYAWLLVQLDVAGAGRRWLLLLMGLGKLASYGASAQLHHGQFSQLEALTGALRVDLAAIPLSIGANNLPLARSPAEFFGLLAATACFFAANALCVRRQLRGALGLRQGSKRVRESQLQRLISRSFPTHFGCFFDE